MVDTQIEGLAKKGDTIRKKVPEGAISTMLVLKWSYLIEGPRSKVYGPMRGGLYKKDPGSIVPWSGTHPDTKFSCFTWSKDEIYLIVPGYHYNE